MEHHAAIIVQNNQAAVIRVQTTEKAAAKRDILLVNKEEELRSVVDDAVAGVERVMNLEDTVIKHSKYIRKNAEKVQGVKEDFTEAKSKVDIFVEKARSTLES